MDLGINSALKTALGNPVVYNAAFISTAVLAGYCLQPVPKAINNAFNTSHLLKFLVLLIMTVIAMEPADDSQLGLIALVVVLLLTALQCYRDM